MPYVDLLQLLENKKEERICGAIPKHYTYPRLQTLRITFPSPQQKRSMVPGPFWFGLAGVLLTISFATAQEPDSLILPPLQDTVGLVSDTTGVVADTVRLDSVVMENKIELGDTQSQFEKFLYELTLNPEMGLGFMVSNPTYQDPLEKFPLLSYLFLDSLSNYTSSIFEPAYAEFLIQRHGEEVYFTLLSSNLSELAADLMAKAFPGNVPIPMPWDEFPLDVAVLPVSWSFEEDPRKSNKA